MPDIGETLRTRVYARFGVGGLGVLAALGLAFYVWSHWADIRTWPGIVELVAWGSRGPVPKAEEGKFTVAVADLINDTEDRQLREAILALLGKYEGVDVLRLGRLIPLEGPTSDRAERAGHATAQAYLRESGATILIWGRVLRLGDQVRPDLFLTVLGGDTRGARQYPIETEGAFRLPTVFWEDLSAVLGLVVANRSARFAEQEGHYIADRLTPHIDRVRVLVAADGRPGWDARAIAKARFHLANALVTFGAQSGRNAPLEEAVRTYRAVLKEYVRDRMPLDWAATQNNLGSTLAILGARESGRARLEEAVTAHRSALEELTRDRVPLMWAAAKNNLAIALLSLGERESGTARLEEAVTAHRAALELYETFLEGAEVTNYILKAKENLARTEAALAARRAE